MDLPNRVVGVAPLRLAGRRQAVGELRAVGRGKHRHHRDAGEIDEEAVRAMLERLDLQEAGVSARLESRF